MRQSYYKYILILLSLCFISEVVFSRGVILNQEPVATIDSLNRRDSLAMDSLKLVSYIDSMNRVNHKDTLLPPKKAFLDDVISGQNKDSLVYDVKNKMVHIYNKGDVKYQNMNMKADYMRINMDNKEIFAHGVEDTTKKLTTRPEFMEGKSTYTMDTITYNIDTKKARIKGVETKEGEGILLGSKVKKMPDNTINIAHGKYTTCDNPAHPHFYLAMTKAKAIPGKKVIVGPSYLVMEDVPLPFLGLPFGFFPMMGEKHSGFIVPEYGEEVVKGFFIRNGGYYFAFNDYVDATITGGFYTLGSWEAALDSRYVKRYKYSGTISTRFSKDIIGEKGDVDYVNMNNFNINWSHAQDPKFKPNSTFSASVNFSTSGYSKYGSQSLSDYLNTQTNSSISYSKTWAGTPFSMSTNLQHSQNSQDTTVSLSFPNIVLNASRIYPFRRKEAMGKQRWYEKISLSYTGNLTNTVTVKEEDLFTEKMFKNMKNGVSHSIPITTSWNILKYINISPAANYQEKWYFQKVMKAWDPELKQAVDRDTTYGFYRIYDYRFSASASTKVYGTFSFKKGALVEAVRHLITPTVGFSYTPDFSSDKFGFYDYVQSDTLGNMMQYSPFQNGLFGGPSKGRNASMTFSLTNSIEAKVRNRADSTGIKKITIIDNLSFNSSYNFLADSMNLAPISFALRANFTKSLGINLTGTLDPYSINEKGQRINRFMIRDGKLGRITNTSFSFGYTFQSSKSGKPAMNDINSAPVPPAYTDFFDAPGYDQMDANTRRMVMTSKYYDFNIPWNFGFNYSFNYSKPGKISSVTQTLGFNGSITLTDKWGFTFNGGYDFQAKKITPGMFNITRDLHCWQMNFSWVPIGFRKSWSFSISVKSAMLKDLKYDKNSSFYDNLYDN